MSTTPDVSEFVPGGKFIWHCATVILLHSLNLQFRLTLLGYPGTPQHEQTVDDNAENELGNFIEKVKETTGNYLEIVKESLPSNPLAGNDTENKETRNIENNAENKDSGTYVEKIKETTGNYLEKVKESLPSNPLAGNGTENKETRNMENNAENQDLGTENKETRNIENSAENKDSGTYVENIKETTGNYLEKVKESLPSNPLAGNGTENKETRNIENSAENKDSGTYLEKIKESLPSNPLAGSGTENKESKNMEVNAENKDSGTYLEKIKESLPSNPFTGSGTENKESKNIEKNTENKGSTYLEKIKESLPSNPLTGSGTENKESKNIENKDSGNNAEKSKDDKIREAFPLRFEPNPSLKDSDNNNLTNATNQGSSALGSVGINPAAIIGGGSESPRHPYYRDNPPEAAGGEIDTSHTVKPADQLQTSFDLTGDYNKQKEREQTAEHKAKLAQKRENKKHEKPERIDLGVKPLGGQQPPLPYKPEETAGDTDHVPGKTTAVHPEGNVSPTKATKKDKVNATVGRAVGTLKQKIGKLVRNDSLTAKGTEEKAEAAELRKKKRILNLFFFICIVWAFILKLYFLLNSYFNLLISLYSQFHF